MSVLRVVAIGLLLLAMPALASSTVVVQGRLTNLAGQGVDGSYTLTFRLFESAAGGSPFWQEILPAVPIDGGAFSATLGDSTPLDADLLTRPEVWIEVVVAGEPPLGRQRMQTVPYAILADRAQDVRCTNCVSPEETTFMAGCSNGQILRKSNGTWGCVDLVTYSGTDFALSDQACQQGQVMRGVGPDGAPICVADKDTTYSGANFAASGQGCAAGWVVTGIGLDGSVTCAPDNNTTYSGANFALSSQSCPAGQVVRGIDSAGNPQCVTDKNDQYTGANFALSGKSCPPGSVVSGIASDGAIICAVDKDTTYTGANFAQSNKACPAGSVITAIAADGTPVCAPDKDTTYTGATFALSNKVCAAGQVQRGTDTAGNPVCVPVTTYTGANFATSNQSCGTNQVMKGIDASGNAICVGMADYVNSNCYVYFGWLDGCDACTNVPTKFGRVNANACSTVGGDGSCSLTSFSGLDTVRVLGLNTDGDVDNNDKFYIGFKCY